MIVAEQALQGERTQQIGQLTFCDRLIGHLRRRMPQFDPMAQEFCHQQGSL